MKKLLGLSLILFLSISLMGVTGEQVLKNVNSRFSKLKTMQADFKQIQMWESVGQKSESSGRFFFKQKDQFRLELGKDYIICDGKTVWRYNSSSNQVLIENTKDNDDTVLPGQMFLNFYKNYDLKDFTEKKIDGEKFYILKMSGKKGEEKFISKITAYINEDFLATRLEYEDLDDNKTTLSLSNIITNNEVAMEKFQYKPGKKAEVVDLRK